MELCPCDSGESYQNCCAPLHKNKAKAKTPEALMRARYCAYVTADIEFIAKTQTTSNENFDAAAAMKWAKESKWKGLKIIKTSIAPKKDQGMVEFVAHYQDQNEKNFYHHEISDFVFRNDQWLFDKGTIVGLDPIKRSQPKVGRNDDCPCGSGKKFKKCCG
ncbi:MAG: YchJ family protein [Bacteriovoracaceae bacterium]|nr:YchJ family protein [Bacteriovoracaceae bacterium]